jgi:putative membrane protein
MLGVALLAGVSCGALAQSSAAPASDPMTHGMQSDGSHDAMFMRQAAADGLAEVQLGRMALDKASSAEVRQLAQRIVDDHTMANQQLMDIARRKSVSLPTEPMPMQKQEADHLKTLSGKDFDQAYALAMVKDHRKAIKLFGMQSTGGSDTDLKQFASATLPKLKMHLQMAEQAAGANRMHHTGAMDHGTATPMDSNGSMGMPASGSSTR